MKKSEKIRRKEIYANLIQFSIKSYFEANY